MHDKSREQIRLSIEYLESLAKPTKTILGVNMTIYKKLNDARAEFHARELKKSGENKFAGYKYFELADFVQPALEIFNKHGLCAVVSFDKDYALMCIVDIETSDKIAITSPMAEANLKGCHPIQNLGAVETYQRRYLWMAALEIIEHDALDSAKPVEPDFTHDPKEKAPPLSAIPDNLIDAVMAIKESCAINDIHGVAEVWAELTDDEKTITWKSQTKGGGFNQAEKKVIHEASLLIAKNKGIDK
jgi:hypothetical protein